MKENEPSSERLTLERVTRLATDEMLTNERHVPLALLEGSQGMYAVAIDELRSDHEERVQQMFRIGFGVGMRGDTGKLEQVFFITEAWVSQAKDGEMPDVPPSEDPDRLEVLLITHIDMVGEESRLVIMDILRDGDGTFRELVPSELTQPQTTIESPLMNGLIVGYKMGTKARGD